MNSIDPLKKMRRRFYLKIHFVPRSRHFSSRLWKPVTLYYKRWSPCLFWDKYRHVNTVGQNTKSDH